jgi:hypothetical protein
MSLLHLPIYLALYVYHRVPNHGQWTWERLMLKLQQGTEDAERSFVSYTGAPELSLRSAGMLFPFSPPIALPCPFHAAKEGLKEGVDTIGRLPDLTRPESDAAGQVEASAAVVLQSTW